MFFSATGATFLNGLLWAVASVIGLWVFCWFSLLLHEMGHLLAGRIVGLPAAEVRLGSGRIWRAFQWGHTRWLVHRHPISGWVANHRAGNRMQEAITILGGPLATAILAFFLWRLVAAFPPAGSSRLMAEVRGICQMFAMVETGGLLLTLWPSWCHVHGQRLRNDGLLLWHLFFPSRGNKKAVASDPIAEAMQAGNLDQAVRLAREAAQSCTAKEWDNCQGMLASTLVVAGRIEEAAAVYREQLNTMKPEDPRFREAADAFASLALYHHRPELYSESEAMIRTALQAAPLAHTLKGTLGGLLAERGADEEALTLLRDLHARAENETDLGIPAAYLSMLAAQKGAAVEAEKFRRQALLVLPNHPLVRRVLGIEENLAPAPVVETAA